MGERSQEGEKKTERLTLRLPCFFASDCVLFSQQCTLPYVCPPSRVRLRLNGGTQDSLREIFFLAAAFVVKKT